MTATSHALIGTVIAAKIGNPALAIPLALASHVLADMTPHWDEALNSKNKTKERIFFEVIVDMVLGLSLSYATIVFLFPKTDFLYAFIIVIFAQLPDWLLAPYYFFKIKYFKWAYEFGKKTNREIDKPWGVINQILVVVGLILLAKFI